MTDLKQLVIIGGTAAGLSAASRARRIDSEMKILVFEKLEHISYGSCGLPYFVGDIIKDFNELISFTAKEFKEKRNIDVYIKHEVASIDRENKTVKILNRLTTEIFIVKYDYLVIATGACPIVPKVEGINNNENFHFLRNIEDGISIKEKVMSNNIKKASIIGGGLIGIEMAEQLSENGINVTIFEMAPSILGFLNKEFQDLIKKHLEEHHVKVVESIGVKECIFDNGKFIGLRTSNGKEFGADIIISAIGVKPNSKIAKDAGLILGYKDGIVVDEYMRTNDEWIYACGDCVQMTNIISGLPTHIPQGTTANKQGRIAGGNIVGENKTFNGVSASQVTKVFDYYIASTGLTELQAKELGYNVATTIITKSDKASYYPGGKDNHIFLIFDKFSGRILGAQGLGSESVAGRINVIVVAIAAKMTIAELGKLDLVYAPPVAPVYDPLLIAASQAEKKVF